ncbi:hypothetical protein GS40_09225 [Escherichia coli]|nr:hypothetical protein GS40_09225 [Escherichia coli]
MRADFPVLLIAHTSISPVYNPVVYRRYHEDKIRQGDIAMLSDHESRKATWLPWLTVDCLVSLNNQRHNSPWLYHATLFSWVG